MFAALLSIPAALFTVLAWIAYRHSPRARLFSIAAILGVGYWYVLPGTLFLVGGEVVGADADLMLAGAPLWQAILLVHASLVLLLLLPTLAWASHKGQSVTTAPRVTRAEMARVDALLAATVISALAFFAYRYAEQGPAIALQLVVGLASAREFMTFENFSSGASQSLLALWEIVNIFLATFLAATFAWQRRTLSIRFVGVTIAALLAFVASGSRTVLLLLLFAVVIAFICRPPRPAHAAFTRSRGRARRSLLPLLLITVLVVTAALAMLARFQDDPSQAESLALNSIGSHNDMFRELVFVLRNGWNYRSDAVLFLQTPITYAMPTFLGFDKSIAPHLIDFNLDRAGIDLIAGEGNVFPGLIADMVLCFGLFAPVVLCIFSSAMFLAFAVVADRGRASLVGSGLLVTLLCYYVISFRNLQGSFGILLVLAAALSFVLSGRSAGLKRRRHRAPRKVVLNGRAQPAAAA